MKKIRVFAVLLLCVALLAFAGCGEKKSDQDTENGTVTEETLNHVPTPKSQTKTLTIGGRYFYG